MSKHDFVLALSPLLQQPSDSMAACGQNWVLPAGGLSGDRVQSDELRMTWLKESVTTLYAQLHQPVFRYLLWMRVRPQEAEDILQESFLRLYIHLHDNGQNINLKGWVYRVAHNLACSRARKQKFQLEMSPEHWQETCASTMDSSAGPEEVLLHKEKMVQLHLRVMQLSELQQNCVRLRMEGFRYQEISDILNVSIATVAGSLRHAIGNLARCQ
jgi:RNA polymerase sigma-70 factor (ECF subfamily)